MTKSRERVHTFLVLREPGRADRIVVWDTQDITVGRASDNDLALEHEEVSRHHATFLREGGGWMVRHLSSTNETLVNGAPIKDQVIQHRDVVRIAGLDFAFYQGPRNPLASGLKVAYASQLKAFSVPGADTRNPDATVLGLMENLAGDDELRIDPPGDFEAELQGMPRRLADAPAARKLDLEIEADAPADTLSFHIEIDGAGPELRDAIQALLGKELELSQLRLRLEADELD